MPTRILLVDDHQMLRDGLRLRLELEKDFVVTGEAMSAQEAYAFIEQNVPDVVIMDLNLPGENGIAATRRIRAERPELKILIVTSSSEAGVARDALLAGANGFLRKEDASADLVRAIRVVLEGKIFLSPDAATDLTDALREKNSPREPSLTERELAVLKGVAEGMAYKEIADALKISVKSVETYRARLVRKLGYSTRAELIRYAVRKGLVAP
jgi:two-component system invasion response regulator UvrY